MRLILLLIIFIFISCEKQSEKEIKSEAYIAHIKAQEAFYSEIKNQNSNWIVRATIQPGDTEHVILMTYSDEIGLTLESVYCMTVFENNKTKEYKLVAPWISTDYRIQKSNIKKDEIKIVSKKEIQQ